MLGNNILPALPELARVFESRRCRGALASLLGPGYLMHPHRFCHQSEPGRQAQTWHRDSFWGHWYPRSHRLYWVMAFYFPQDTPVEVGPTGILPGSQYFHKDREGSGPLVCGRFSDRDLHSGILNACWNVQEKHLTCRAGSVFLIHYDLWHRGGANVSQDGLRFMFKFQFSRLAPPPAACGMASKAAGSDQVPSSPWEPFLLDSRWREGLVPLWQGVWEWLHGETANGAAPDGAPPDEAGAPLLPLDWEKLLADLALRGDHHEPRRVAAAWALGRSGAPAARLVSELGRKLQLWGRHAAQALEAAGPAAMPALLLEAPRLRKSAAAVHALGRLLDAAGPPESVAAGPAGNALSFSVPGSRDLRPRSRPPPTATEQQAAAARLLEEICTSQGDCDCDGDDDGDGDMVRICAAEALGCTRQPGLATTLMRIMRMDRKGDVRASAGHALLRLVEAGCLDSLPDSKYLSFTEAISAVETCTKDRYAAAYAAEVLHRLHHRRGGSATARCPPLIRWCRLGDGWNARGG